jgi:two-component system, OmpR family, sensor histidine kinase MprB
MSLRSRIALATAISVAAISLVLGAIGYLGTRARLFSEVNQELATRAAPYLVPHDGRDQDRDNGPQGHDAGRRACAQPGDIRIRPSALGGPTGYIQSICPNGRVVADEGGSPKLPVTPRVRAIARAAAGRTYFSASVDSTPVQILAIGDKPDRKAIEVALPLTATDHTLDGLLITYLLLAGVGILLAGIVGLAIGRAAVAPILRFAARSEQATSSLIRPGRLELGPTSEMRRLATSFNRTLDALEESIRAQRHLIADASHELRTPLTALRSNIQIFLDAGELPPEERLELQAAIVAELDELTQLVSDVVELARGSRSDDRVEPIELDLVVRDAVERARRRAPDMRFALDLTPTVIDGSPDLVVRAVGNLIDNARKWSSPDGLVEVSLDGSTVTVRDHGPGIADGDLPHVFDRFYRSDRARRMPGSGLGLAIVKQAAEAHGGSASAANAPGGGALMRVSFGVATHAAPAQSASHV